MGNVCRTCGYTIDEGMKIFSLLEMFMALYHVIVASSTGSYVVDPVLKKWPDNGVGGFALIMIMILLIVFMIGLCAQAVFGILLYFLGLKKRNVTVCLIWIILACINFAMPWLVLSFASIGTFHHRGLWTMYYLYLLYLIAGVWIVSNYMKWAKETGIAVHFRKSGNPISSNATNTNRSQEQQQQRTFHSYA